MANLDNVRLFVIDALKKYHGALTNATNNALTTTLADYTPWTSYTSLENQVQNLVTTGGQPNVIESVKVNGTALTITNKAVDVTVPTKLTDLTNDGNFVTDANYVHTDNNYTSTEKTKLGGIEEGAQVNKIETITVDGAATTISNKSVNVDLSAYPNAATWDSTNHQIVFKHGATQLFTVDGADFIKDGMIDAISITTGTGTNAGKNVLKIDFNTDAEDDGKVDIEIPLDDIFDPDNYYDKTEADSTFVKKTDEKKLSLASNTPSAAGTNKANVISNVAVNDHQITATYTAVLTTETQLSLGTKSGTGNVITGLSVSNHQITASYGITALTEDTQAEISISGTTPTAVTNRTAVITAITPSGTKNHTLTLSYANVVTSETQLSMSGSAPTAAGTDKAKVISQLTVSDHAITASYTEVLTEHQSLANYVTKTDLSGQSYVTSGALDTRLSTAAYITASDISGKEDTSNKKDAIIGNEGSSDYYASTKAVASYIGSLAELSTDELASIFATS